MVNQKFAEEDAYSFNCGQRAWRIFDHRAESGFTLLEVLAALAVLGCSLAVILPVLSESLSLSRISEKNIAARALAESILHNAMHAEVTALTNRIGDTDDNLQWQLQVGPYSALTSRSAWKVKVVQLKVTVRSVGIRRIGKPIEVIGLRTIPNDGGTTP